LLGIPVVIDRMVHSHRSGAHTDLRPGILRVELRLSTPTLAHGALRQVQTYVEHGYRVAVDLDLEKFFDRVQHDVLMARVARKVADKRVLALIGRFLRAGVMVDGIPQPTEQGTPQGGPLSPLLSNILLDDLDKELERRGLRFARYADDLVILVRTQRAGERVKRSITRYLTGVLQLLVNEKKSRVAPIHECVFLSFTFLPGYEASRVGEGAHRIPTSLKRAHEPKLGRLHGVPVHETRPVPARWMGYFGISTTTGRSPSWTDGCGDGCGCAIGNSGASPALASANS